MTKGEKALEITHQIWDFAAIFSWGIFAYDSSTVLWGLGYYFDAIGAFLACSCMSLMALKDCLTKRKRE